MSNILEKDRRDLMPDSKALKSISECLELTAKVVYDEDKIPKRRRYIGERLLNTNLDAYECARYANLLFGDNAKEKKQRIDHEYKAERAMINLASDINILPKIVPSINHKKNWYNEWQSAVIISYKITKGWRKSDEKRFAPENKISKSNKKV